MHIYKYIYIYENANTSDKKKRNLTRENLDVAKKEKPKERNWISSKNSPKQHHKDKLCQSKKKKKKKKTHNKITDVDYVVIETKLLII